MASLFTPESERIRSGQAKAEGTRGAPASSIKIPGMPGVKGQKSGDSTGNPNSPGYEPWGRKKPREAAAEESTEAKGPAGVVIETTVQGPELIRLSAGWEKVLLAQRKLCEKAKGLFTLLEGPDKYRSQKKGTLLSGKSRGCIVDLDSQKTQEEKEAEAKAKSKESA